MLVRPTAMQQSLEAMDIISYRGVKSSRGNGEKPTISCLPSSKHGFLSFKHIEVICEDQQCSHAKSCISVTVITVTAEASTTINLNPTTGRINKEESLKD